MFETVCDVVSGSLIRPTLSSALCTLKKALQAEPIDPRLMLSRVVGRIWSLFIGPETADRLVACKLVEWFAARRACDLARPF